MMTIFWAVAAALMAIAVWFVVPPLTRGNGQSTPSRREINLALHRDKLAELEADRARGTLSAEQFEQARSDLERHLLQDLLADEAQAPIAQRPQPRWLVQGLIVALPLSAIAFYLGVQSVGRDLPVALAASPSPSSVASDAAKPMGMPAMNQHPQAGGGGQAKAMSMEEAVVQLSKRLEAKPDDGDGWLLLGNSYRFLGKQKEADEAFKKAAALGKTPPKADAAPAAASTAQAKAPEAATPPALDAKGAEALRTRLAKEPKDLAGWAELALYEHQQRRFSEAAAAYRKAIELDPRNADLLAAAADAVASASNSLDGEPSKLIEQALAADPNHHKALWLAASAARQRGDHAKALALWERLAKVLPPDSDDARIIAANIAEARAEAGAPAAAESTAAAAAAPAAAARIRGTVVIDDALRKELGGDETLFVFARAVNGPPMPLAVLRKQASDLPLEFELDDSMALMPTNKLSNAQQVVVGARVSKSGNAIAQPGDLQGVTDAVEVGPDVQVHIVIDKRS